jgi:hypothetical protein
VCIYGHSRGVRTLQVYCAREVTLYQAIITRSGVQIGVSRLYTERASEGKEPGMGNNTIFLKNTHCCNFSINILITSLFNACTQSLSIARGSSLSHRKLGQFTIVCTNAFLEDRKVSMALLNEHIVNERGTKT